MCAKKKATEAELYEAMEQLFFRFLEDIFVDKYTGADLNISVGMNEDLRVVIIALECKECSIGTLACIPFDEAFSRSAEHACIEAALVATVAGDKLCEEGKNPFRSMDGNEGHELDMGLTAKVREVVTKWRDDNGQT